MDKDTVYFISLLSAFINGQDPQQEGDVNWEKVYRLSTVHAVSGIAYLIAKKLKGAYPLDNVLLNQMKKEFKATLVKSVKQEAEIERIIEKLIGDRIPHAFMKGFVVKNYYPVKEMRTMGDIDFLIKPEDRLKTHSMMLELGYEAGQIEGEVWDYTLGTVHLEIHTQIMYRNIANGVDYVSYFSDTWGHVRRKVNGYTYELTEEYHFLFLLVHIAKHFDGSGCGIRMIMDIAMYLIYYKDRLNWNYIEDEIEKLQLVQFSETIFSLCNLWFSVEFPEKLPRLEEHFYRDLSHYILSAGTFGFYQRNSHARKLRIEYTNEKETSQVLSIIRMYRKTCFPSYEKMSKIKKYSFLRKRPILLPVAWIDRAYRSIIVKGNRSLGMLVDISEIKEEAKVQYELFYKLGL